MIEQSNSAAGTCSPNFQHNKLFLLQTTLATIQFFTVFLLTSSRWLSLSTATFDQATILQSPFSNKHFLLKHLSKDLVYLVRNSMVLYQCHLHPTTWGGGGGGWYHYLSDLIEFEDIPMPSTCKWWLAMLHG